MCGVESLKEKATRGQDLETVTARWQKMTKTEAEKYPLKSMYDLDELVYIVF